MTKDLEKSASAPSLVKQNEQSQLFSPSAGSVDDFIHPEDHEEDDDDDFDDEQLPSARKIWSQTTHRVPVPPRPPAQSSMVTGNDGRFINFDALNSHSLHHSRAHR